MGSWWVFRELLVMACCVVWCWVRFVDILVDVFVWYSLVMIGLFFWIFGGFVWFCGCAVFWCFIFLGVFGCWVLVLFWCFRFLGFTPVCAGGWWWVWFGVLGVNFACSSDGLLCFVLWLGCKRWCVCCTLWCDFVLCFVPYSFFVLWFSFVFGCYLFVFIFGYYVGFSGVYVVLCGYMVDVWLWFLVFVWGVLWALSFVCVCGSGGFGVVVYVCFVVCGLKVYFG